VFLQQRLPYRRARHAVGTALAVGRVGLGASALVAPRSLLTMWVGETAAAGPAAQVFGRALAGRDLALGALALRALAAGRPPAVRATIALGAFADGVDMAATLRAWPELPAGRRWLVLGLTLGATVAGALAVVD
jgi:hypothetical protein